MDHAIKVERLKAMVDEDADARSLTSLGRVVSEDTVARIGKGLSSHFTDLRRRSTERLGSVSQ